MIRNIGIKSLRVDHIRDGYDSLGHCALARAPFAFVPDADRLQVMPDATEWTLRHVPMQLSLSQVGRIIRLMEVTS